jgi:hypothetical protein
MARVTHVKKAQKAQGPCTKCRTEIKVGDPYCWWKFLRGPRYVRCAKAACSPKPSDLTRSEFYSTLYDLGDRLQSALDDFRTGGDASDLSSELNDIASDLRTLGEECRDKYSNMPEGLQQGDTGQLLETRADECDSKADELESAASTLDSFEEPEDEDDKESARDDAATEADIDLSVD